MTVQYVVASFGGKSYFYLNSSKEIQSKDNIAVALPPKTQTGKWSNPTAEMFVGKLIRAAGIVKVKDSTMVEIAEPKDLEIVEILAPTEAAKKIGERVTVEYVVQSCGGKSNLYLNSTEDFKAKDNFAVMLTSKIQSGKWTNSGPDTFVGKRSCATGAGETDPNCPDAGSRRAEGSRNSGQVTPPTDSYTHPVFTQC